MQLLQIEIFAACLIGAGLIIAKVSNWLRPPQQETTIETNVPWLTLAGTPETAGQSGPPARESEAESEQ